MSKPVLKIGLAALAVALLVATAGAGYWLGNRGADGAHEAAATPTTDAAPARKLLFYRNPMGLPDTSPVPKKDPMGMDYIPVYAGEEPQESDSGIRISTEKVQKLGVRTEPAAMRVIDRSVSASARIEADERRQFAITPKYEGYIERLHVNTVGQAVAKGQVLFEVYSPELVSAQREYLIAAQGIRALKDGGEALADMQRLADASLLRLRNWDITDTQIKALVQSGEVRRTLSFRSPVGGVITSRKALQGMRFMPGEALYEVADLSSVWVVADVFEQDLAFVKNGSSALVKINAYPEREFRGRVSFIYPTLNAETRTVPVRLDLANPGMLLKPAMFAQVAFTAEAGKSVVTVPESAVIDSGTRSIALVQLAEGRFEPREVKIGARGTQYVEIIEGVRDGELVVVAANFLIDAESNLQAAVGGFGAAPSDASAPAQAPASKPISSSVSSSGTAHRASGKVDEVDRAGLELTLTHGPVASLKWPAMTMPFKLAHEGLLQGLTPGANVDVEFVERAPGEWVITRVTPARAAAVPKPAATPDPHAGH